MFEISGMKFDIILLVLRDLCQRGGPKKLQFAAYGQFVLVYSDAKKMNYPPHNRCTVCVLPTSYIVCTAR